MTEIEMPPHVMQAFNSYFEEVGGNYFPLPAQFNYHQFYTALKTAEYEQEARKLAAEEWTILSESDEPIGKYSGFDFKCEYPSCEAYVNEWWEERYLPAVLKRHGIAIAV